MKIFLSGIGMLLYCFICFGQQKGIFVDPRDGKHYKTIMVEGQTWFAENLAYKTDSGCWAYDNNMKNVPVYGYLYTYQSAKAGCPTGWHLSFMDDWNQLIDHFGGDSLAGNKLRSARGWDSVQHRGNNRSGFSALPGGFRYLPEGFSNDGFIGYWWCADPDGNAAYYITIYNENGEIDRSRYDVGYGLSVRCIRDN